MAETPSQAQSGFWTSDLNRRPEVRKDFVSRQAVKFYDTTLRDGEQSVCEIWGARERETGYADLPYIPCGRRRDREGGARVGRILMH